MVGPMNAAAQQSLMGYFGVPAGKPTVVEFTQSLVAEVESGDAPANGVIVALGGRFGGWALHVKDGIPMNTDNFLGPTRSVGSGV